MNPGEEVNLTIEAVQPTDSEENWLEAFIAELPRIDLCLGRTQSQVRDPILLPALSEPSLSLLTIVVLLQLYPDSQ